MFEPRVPLTRLEKEIVAFEQQPIEKGKILFYGSSGFTRWNTQYKNHAMEDDLRMKDGSQAVVNHGCGSSTAEELLYYYPRAIKPWEPRALVVSIVHNDRGFWYSPNEILTNLSKLLEYARTDFPGIKLYLCDCRPTLKFNTSWHLDFQKEFHQLLKEYCARHEDTTYVCHADCIGFWEDPNDAGIYDENKLRKDIFVADDVHFNQAGYDIYTKFWEQVLDDLL